MPEAGLTGTLSTGPRSKQKIRRPFRGEVLIGAVPALAYVAYVLATKSVVGIDVRHIVGRVGLWPALALFGETLTDCPLLVHLTIIRKSVLLRLQRDDNFDTAIGQHNLPDIDHRGFSLPVF